jgi:hypothetical protein
MIVIVYQLTSHLDLQPLHEIKWTMFFTQDKFQPTKTSVKNVTVYITYVKKLIL